MKPYLIDDGTLDTVIGVGDKEYRYNYDPSDGDQSYKEFVSWCMDDAVEQYEMDNEVIS